MTANQALIDEIVANVLAKLQPIAARQVMAAMKPAPPAVPSAVTVAAVATVAESKPTVVELVNPVITADLLADSVRSGQLLRIGRSSILTPSARDWLHSNRISWSHLERHAGLNGSSTGSRFRWQIILQTVTPTVRALQDGLRSLPDGWKIELVGQPAEAATIATNLVNTAECDGVVVFTEHAELVACKANRNERVRAAVMQNSRQWEQVMRTLSANVVCISPVGRTFVELRNLLRDCASAKPRIPTGF